MFRFNVLVAAAVVLVAVGAAPAAVAAGADAITVVQRQTDVNPGETNPCTADVGTIVDDEQDVFHITTLALGTLQLTGHSTVGVTFIPDDPTGVTYIGRETFNFAATGNGPTFTTTMAIHVRVRGTDGSFLTLRELAHLTVAGGGVVVAFDRPTLACS